MVSFACLVHNLCVREHGLLRLAELLHATLTDPNAVAGDSPVADSEF